MVRRPSGHLPDAVLGDEPGLRRLQVAELRGDARVLLHGAADDGDLAAEGLRGVEHLLDARDVGGEGGHDDAAFEAFHDLPEGLAHGALGGRVAGVLGPRRVRHEAEDALLAEARQVVEVGELAVHGRVVELEVAGVDDVPEGRPDAQAHGVGDRVADAERRHVEVAELHGLARLERTERVVAQLVLAELGGQQATRQRRGVHGHAGELGQDVRQAADVVLVGVGDDEGADPLAPVAQVGDVGHDEVDAVHLLLGEHESAVDDDDLVGELEDGHVLADLADAAERDDPEDLVRGGGRARDGHQKSPSWSSGTGLPRVAAVPARRPADPSSTGGVSPPDGAGGSPG